VNFICSIEVTSVTHAGIYTINLLYCCKAGQILQWKQSIYSRSLQGHMMTCCYGC